MHKSGWLNAEKYLAVMLCVAAALLGGCKVNSKSGAGPNVNSLTISGTPAASVTAGQQYQFQPAAIAATGATISFSVQNKPAWATLNTATGQFSGTPTAADVGTYSNIAISVSDGATHAALSPFHISVIQNATAPAIATIFWTPPSQNLDGTALTDLAGFRIYYGNNANALVQSITVSNPGLTSYVLANLARGSWYFAVAAFTAQNVESELSQIVSKTI